MEWMGDERDVLRRSGDHLAAGELVVTAPADEAGKATAARILADHGAHDMAHFGTGHWEPWGLDRAVEEVGARRGGTP